MKTIDRFYKDVSVEPVKDGYAVLLDGRPVKTEAGHPFTFPNEAMAESVAGEWRSQGEKVVFETMPQMRIAAIAIDHVRPEREKVLSDLLAYAGTDLLCYRADAPEKLVRRQAEAWDPWLEWTETKFGIRPVKTRGIMPVSQPEELVQAFRQFLEEKGAFYLAGLTVATRATGSLILSLAFLEGELSQEELFQLCRLDEDWQTEQWGEVREARPHQAAIYAEIEAAGRFRIFLE